MFEGLYVLHIEEKNRELWQLRLEGTYYCLSAVPTEEDVIRCIKNHVKTYRSELKLKMALRELEDHGKISNKVEYARQEALFKEQAHLHESLVAKAIKEAHEEIKMDSTVIKNSKKFKKVSLAVEVAEEIAPTPPLKKELKPVSKKPVMGFKRIKI